MIKKINSILYHGTPTMKNGLSILEDNCIKTQFYESDTKDTKHLMTPITGKIYVSPNLAYTIRYTIKLAKRLGEHISNKECSKNKYGYLFIIDNSDIKTIQPDEDSIGHFIGTCMENPSLPYAKWLLPLAKKYIDEDTLKGIKDGYFIDYAYGGKHVVNHMTNKQKKELINLGSHIAIEGKSERGVKFLEAWKFDKTNNIFLKSDGSNFFDYAIRIK